MIEVVPVGNQWTWRMICMFGRILVYTAERFDTDFQAADAAKAYRSSFQFIADSVDHRQARAI